KRLALDVRHGIPEQVPLLASRKEWHDVRVLQLRRNLDLAAEPVAIYSSRELWRQHLHDDCAPEHTIDRHKDATHPATRQLTIELIVGPQRILEVLSEFCHLALRKR